MLIRDGEEQDLPGKVQFWARRGDVLSMRTPGGGGWGAPEESFGDAEMAPRAD
ncbi:MAG: hypothetical protein ACK2T0_01285 [Anaerolineales bacterium]